MTRCTSMLVCRRVGPMALISMSGPDDLKSLETVYRLCMPSARRRALIRVLVMSCVSTSPRPSRRRALTNGLPLLGGRRTPVTRAAVAVSSDGGKVCGGGHDERHEQSLDREDRPQPRSVSP